MAPEVEARFAEIQKMKASELRTKLQELGFFQANGKKTKIKTKDEGETPEKKVRKFVAGTIISNVQIKELRTALGNSQPQLGDCKNKRKNGGKLGVWYCRPPGEDRKAPFLPFTTNTSGRAQLRPNRSPRLNLSPQHRPAKAKTAKT